MEEQLRGVPETFRQRMQEIKTAVKEGRWSARRADLQRKVAIWSADHQVVWGYMADRLAEVQERIELTYGHAPGTDAAGMSAGHVTTRTATPGPWSVALSG